MKKGDLVVRLNAKGNTVDHGILLSASPAAAVFNGTDRISTVLFHKEGIQKVMLSSLRKANI